jgi:DNA replication protein DnaC
MDSECKICDGVGLVRVQAAAGMWVSRACECQPLQAEQRRLEGAKIPKKYWKSTLETYNVTSATPQSQKKARMIAKTFVNTYPVDTAGKGLLFVGSAGLGKTHLAVGVLQGLLKDRGARGLFCDYSILAKNIQWTFDQKSSTSEQELLEPVQKAEILVLDDLGALRPTEWVLDNISAILRYRYNNELSTIITTNYQCRPAGNGEQTDLERAAKAQTLGDRIGDQMLSRVEAMCLQVPMDGNDFRREIQRPTLPFSGGNL